MRRSRLGLSAVLASAVLGFAGSAGADGTPTDLQSVSLEAVVIEGARPLQDVHFSLRPLDLDSQDGISARSVNGPAVVKVPAGRYRVTASYGDTVREQDISVGKDSGRHVLNLRAGTVRMKAIPRPGGAVMRNNVSWEILTYGKDSNGNRHHVAQSAQSQPVFTLPEGYYLAKVTNGAKTVKHTIEVTSGQTYKYTVVLR